MRPRTSASGRATLTCVRALLPLLVVLAVAGCSIAPSGASEHTVDRGLEAPQRLQVQVLEVRPHDRSAFTQGFELAEGVLYESTGQIGRSAILATDPETGAVRQRIDLPEPLFGEGITVVGQRIWQLTWRDGVAIERDTATLAELRRVSYPGQGWGLCYDGARLVMSDGTDRLVFRDPSSFAPVGEVRVRLADGGVGQLNELECAGGSVWANVWQTDRILRIDPTSGAVLGWIDLTGLLRPEDQTPTAEVLNGIAYDAAHDRLFVTGKFWPRLYQIRLKPMGG